VGASRLAPRHSALPIVDRDEAELRRRDDRDIAGDRGAADVEARSVGARRQRNHALGDHARVALELGPRLDRVDDDGRHHRRLRHGVVEPLGSAADECQHDDRNQPQIGRQGAKSAKTDAKDRQ
jgi:hypothetical protein